MAGFVPKTAKREAPENIAISHMHKAYQHLRQKIQPVFVST